MNDIKKTANKHFKKEAGLKVAETLTAALQDLKQNLGDKKFLRNIKKASKVLIAGLTNKTAATDTSKTIIKKAAVKKPVVKKEIVKKGPAKKATQKASAKKSTPKAKKKASVPH